MATEKTEVDLTESLVAEFGENASYVADLLARWRANPSAVDEEWRAFFQERLGEAGPAKGEGRTARAAQRGSSAEAAASAAEAESAASQSRTKGEAAAAPERTKSEPKVESEVVAPRALREGEERQPIR